MLNWEEIVQDYIIKHSNLIKKVTEPLRDHFGVCYFTYHRIDEEGKYTVLVDRPDWAEFYVGQKVFLKDPYLRHPRNYESGVVTIDSHGSEEYLEQVLQGGKQILHADRGAMLIQKEATYVEFFGIAGNQDMSCLEKLYLNNLPLFKSFATYFKEELSSTLTQMEGEAGLLLDLKGADFFNNEPVIPGGTLEARQAYLLSVGRGDEVTLAKKLSPREKMCLKLLIQGKSAKETALTLKLSPRTIESYFENIKDKLSCWGKPELFAIAQKLEELGLLSS